MSPTKGRSAVIGAAALAATAAIGIPGIAQAQSADQPSTSDSARPGPGRHGPGLEAAAKVLNLSVEDLRNKLEAGKTLAEVAGDQGVEVQTLIDALVADASEHLDQAVADGKLTSDEASQRKADLPDRITEMVNNDFPARGPGGPGERGGPPSLDAAAKVLNLSVDDLRTKLRADDQTLAQIAADQGVDVQAVIDALVADATADLDQAVADGKLTAEQAAERKANLTERITKMVNEGRPPHPEDGRPPAGAVPERASMSASTS